MTPAQMSLHLDEYAKEVEAQRAEPEPEEEEGSIHDLLELAALANGR